MKKRRYALGAASGAAMTQLQEKMLTCALSDVRSCEAPCAAHTAGVCHLPETEVVKLMFGEMKEGGGILFFWTPPLPTLLNYVYACWSFALVRDRVQSPLDMIS